MHSLSLGPSLIVYLVASLTLCSSAEDPIVEVSSGRLVGKAVDFSHKDVNVTRTVHVFKGIPFVEPPVGDLRFRQPQAKQPWEEVYDATEYGPICIQPQNPTFPVRGTQSEDCLFLNVFSPETDSTTKLPVMVWIHGGGLSGGSGSGDYHDGTALAAIGDVIVVSFNYRIGVLGFFATGDSHAAGNYGFYDQIAALQWVQTNIAAFGGDPGKVTVFGESAGSTSIEYLLLSPLTDGLFHRAIMQSGTATMEWFVARPCGDVCQKVAHGLGKLVGCEKSTSEELVNCLRTVSAEDFRDPADPIKGQIQEVTGLGEDELTTIAFPPYIDGHFLKEKPEDVIRDKTFPKKDVNLIIGTMASEGSLYLPLLMAHMANESEISMNRVMYEAMFPTLINGPIKKNPTVVDAVRLMYVNWKDADLEDADYVDSLLQMVGDQLFVCPTDLSARAYSHSSASVYLYHMTHIPSKSIWRLKWMRAAHAEDLPFVFGWHFYHSEDWTMTPEEVEISLQIMKYWTNFAKTGNPNNSSSNGESSEESPYSEWLPFKVPGLSYKDLSTTMENNEGLKAMECSFWNDFIPKLVNLTDGDPVTSGQQRTKCTLNTFLFLLYYGFLAALYSVRM